MLRIGLFLLLLFSMLAAQPEILKIYIDGDINPVSAKYIVDNIDRAAADGYEALLIEMDTPGGLLQATQDIVKGIMEAEVPVIMYVAPSSAGAVSAGVFITMACHVAAMAEGTNIGAAAPVSLGGQRDTTATMKEKVENYAASWARGIAEKRGRNADWIEQAVRESVSINEDEAVEINVVDLIAETQADLLQAIDGRVVKVKSGEVTLDTADATVVERRMNWRQRILYRISNPNLAYILLSLGMLGIFFELQSPGAILPGVLGGIFLILAFMALQTLPVQAAGIALVVFAAILFILEVNVPSFGLLTIGGIAAMFFGSMMLFEDTPGFNFGVDWRVALTIAICFGLFIVFALGKVMQIRVKKPTTGQEGLIGEIGKTLSTVHKEGSVQLHGEIWNACSDEKISKGKPVKVVSVSGLKVKVEPEE